MPEDFSAELEEVAALSAHIVALCEPASGPVVFYALSAAIAEMMRLTGAPKELVMAGVERSIDSYLSKDKALQN